MSDYSVLVAALAELSGERDRDRGIGAPAQLRGHEADRLASLARSGEPPTGRTAPLLRLLRRRTVGRLSYSA
jgi:hypothetical protein